MTVTPSRSYGWPKTWLSRTWAEIWSRNSEVSMGRLPHALDVDRGTVRPHRAPSWTSFLASPTATAPPGVLLCCLSGRKRAGRPGVVPDEPCGAGHAPGEHFHDGDQVRRLWDTTPRIAEVPTRGHT